MAQARVIPFDSQPNRGTRGTQRRMRTAAADSADRQRLGPAERGRDARDEAGEPADAAAGRADAGHRDSGDHSNPGRHDAGQPPADDDVERAAAGDDGACRGVGEALGSLAEQAFGAGWERRAAKLLAFTRRRLTGDYEVDEFGFDPDLNDNVLMALLRPWYERYFRVELRGIANVPSEGGALLVANHSGTLPLDALMTQLALLDHHPAHRHLRMLAADLVFATPFVGELARKSGHTLACAADAERLLGTGHVVGVWPEGFKGIGKPFSQRYKLQRFGRGGFVAAALRSRVPIVPTAIVGAEEIYPMIGNSRTLARLVGLPYFPLTPTFPWLGPLGAVPLPSKWFIAFGEPISTDGYEPGAADDPLTVFNLTDQVRETIQDTLYRLLLERRSVFF